MDSDEFQNDDLLLKYHNYLLKKSWKGDFYRKFVLYPAISKRLVGKTLDVGCGIGKFLSFRPNTVGVDINPYNVKYCQDKGLTAYKIEDLWPFEESSFDSVLLDNVIEHISEPTPLLMQINKVLKKGGRLVIGVPGPAGYAYDADHKVFYTEEKLTLLIESIGYKRINSIHMPLKSKFLENKIHQYCYYLTFIKV